MNMRGMEFGLVLTTLIVFALVLAIVAGFATARFLMRASDPGAPGGGSADER